MTGTFRQKIEELRSATEYNCLVSAREPFNIFRALGVESRELSHSAAMRWLFTSARCRNAQKSLLQKLIEEAELSEIDANSVAQEEPRATLEYASSLKEGLGRIDLLLHYDEAKLTIGFELKVWAAQGDRQLARYQELLQSHFPNHHKMVVLLAPLAHTTHTADKSSSVPVVKLNWRDVADVIESAHPDLDSDERLFADHFLQHITEDIMGKTQKKEVIRDLFREDPSLAQTLRTIIKHRPRLSDLEDQWFAEVARYMSEKLGRRPNDIETKSKGGGTELWACPTRWRDNGLSMWFVFCVHKDEPHYHTMILRKDEKFDEVRFHQLAERCNSFNEDLAPVPEGWSAWSPVLRDQGMRCIEDGLAFDDTVVKKALEYFRDDFDAIYPDVEDFLSND